MCNEHTQTHTHTEREREREREGGGGDVGRASERERIFMNKLNSVANIDFTFETFFAFVNITENIMYK